MDIQFLNPVGTSAVKLQEQIKLLNEKFGFSYVLTGEEKYADLQKMVVEAQTKAKEIQEANGDTNDTQGGAKNETPKSSKDAVYVFLKSPAYVDKDGTQRVAGGLYHIKLSDYPRLSKMPRDICEVFEGEVPVRKLVQIAEFFGVNTEKHEDDELLEVLVSEPTLY